MQCPRVRGESHVQHLDPNKVWYNGTQLCVAPGSKANYARGLVVWDKVVWSRYHLGDNSPFLSSCCCLAFGRILLFCFFGSFCRNGGL